MKYTAVFLTMAIILSAIPQIVYGEHVIDETKKPQFLFVVSAKSGAFEDGTLTLKDVPLVIYFSDRPDRIAGHTSLKKFVEDWHKGADSIKADPPNATLSIFNKDGSKDAVVELSEVRLNEDLLTCKVRALEGNIPKSFGPSSLFIDAFPTAVNGQITD